MYQPCKVNIVDVKNEDIDLLNSDHIKRRCFQDTTGALHCLIFLINNKSSPIQMTATNKGLRCGLIIQIRFRGNT